MPKTNVIDPAVEQFTIHGRGAQAQYTADDEGLNVFALCSCMERAFCVPSAWLFGGKMENNRSGARSHHAKQQQHRTFYIVLSAESGGVAIHEYIL